MVKRQPDEEEPDTASPELERESGGRGRKSAQPRRCILSGDSQTKEQLIRLVVGPNRELVADLAEKLPGHGFWLTATRAAFTEARRKKLFFKAAKAEVTIEKNFEDGIELRLRQRCLDFLGLARRAGIVVMGFDQVVSQLKADKVQLLLTASDGAADSLGKVAALARHGSVKNFLQSNDFDSNTLGMALGRGTAIVHAALAPHRLTGAVCREIQRLRGFYMTEQKNSARD